MPHLKLCRERRIGPGKHELEGMPIALVMSTNKDLIGQFLCYIPDEHGVSETLKEAAKKALIEHKDARIVHFKQQTKTQSKLEALHAAILRGDEPVATPKSAMKAENEFVGKRKRDAWEAAGPTEIREIMAETAARAPAHHIELPEGSFFEPLPTYRPEDRNALKSEYRSSFYVAAPADAGKSVYASGIIARYHKIWPDNPIYGICATKLADDRTYKDLPIKQIPLDFVRKTYGEKKGLKELFGMKGCMVLCDDWDAMEKTRDRPMVLQLIQDILNLGRKMRISIIVTSHLLNNYNQTRAIIHDSEFVTVFPRHTIPNQVRMLLNKVINLDLTATNRVFSMGRWVTVHKTYPQFMLSEKECSLLLSSPSQTVGDVFVRAPRKKEWTQGPYTWTWKGDKAKHGKSSERHDDDDQSESESL